MTLGFGGFGDPAVMLTMATSKAKRKRNSTPKKGKTFFKAHRLAAARILH